MGQFTLSHLYLADKALKSDFYLLSNAHLVCQLQLFTHEVQFFGVCYHFTMQDFSAFTKTSVKTWFQDRDKDSKILLSRLESQELIHSVLLFPMK